MWYLIREMGAVHKIYRGIYAKSNKIHNIFSLKEKIWIGALETFAIGEDVSFFNADHIIADKKPT